MKRTLLILAVILGGVIAGDVTPKAKADGGPIPMCNPNCDCRPGRTNPCTPDKTPRPY